MNGVEAAGYKTFFINATGFEPYDYQADLATTVEWPLAVSVGTGLGKSAATILAWLWRRRFADSETRRRTPRRLVYCLPQRTLVQQTARVVQDWLQNIGLDKQEVDQNLSDVQSPVHGGVPVHVLMGGAVRNDWDIHPEQDAILIGTQDQLLSRALNRGYGVSRFRWPMQFALLHSDVLWVVDEPQLMGIDPLATTAQLQAFRQQYGTYGPADTIWVSATFRREWLRTVDFSPTDGDARIVELGPSDMEKTRARREASKPVTVGPWSLDDDLAAPKKASVYGEKMAQLVLDKHQVGSFTLVICNRVTRAQSVYSALLNAGRMPDGLMLLHSRFRQKDREKLNESLETVSKRDCIVVATQAVEAGVDISAETLITELASWSSLVQRFGRCNRDGNARNPAVVVLDMELHPDISVPYTVSEIQDAKDRLSTLSDARISTLPPIQDEMIAHHVIRKRDFRGLFDTTPDLAGLDIDISPYVRSNDSADVSVYWREWKGNEPKDIKSRPKSDEICHVSTSMLREYLSRMQKGKERKAWMWDTLSEKWEPLGKDDKGTVYPGQVLLLNADLGGYTPEIGFAPDSWMPVPVSLKTPDRSRLETHDGDDDNEDASFNEPITLQLHTTHVVEEADRLVRVFADIPEIWHIREAAVYHDWGKVHKIFQRRLKESLPTDHEGCNMVLAKPVGNRKSTGQREDENIDDLRTGKGFRHEFASALAYMQIQPADEVNAMEKRLIAYLIAAHHGKVRLSARSIPDEQIPIPLKEDNGEVQPMFARGVWEGDTLEATALTGDVSVPTVTLSLDCLQLGQPRGEADDMPVKSWMEGTLSCLDTLGPFKLAWLEAMLRVADWRASAKEANVSEPEV